MFTIKSKTSFDQIRKAADGEQHVSQERREMLEKLAMIHVPSDIYVEISGEQAYADISTRDSRLGYSDRVIINVPAEIPEQHSTDYEDDVWELLFQKAELYHELGHVLYSDWERYEETLFGPTYSRIGNQRRPLYKSMFNIIEDAAIERLLRRRFNIADELEIKNENLLRDNKPEERIYIAQAICLHLIEYKHPIGFIDEVLDRSEIPRMEKSDHMFFQEEIKPLLDQHTPAIVNEDDAAKRAEMIRELFDAVNTAVGDRSIQPDMHLFGFAPDTEENDGEGPRGDPPFTGGGGGGGGEGGIGGLDADIQHDYEQELQNEPEPEDTLTDDLREIRDTLRVIDTEYDLDTDMEVELLSDDDNFRPDDYQEAKRLSIPLARELEQRLQQERKSKQVGGQRTGKPNNRQLHKTQRGKTNVFKRRVDPDEKDYQCVMVLDRSSSMKRIIKQVEVAAMALILGLEEVGVDISVLSVYDRSVCIEKGFSESGEEVKKTIISGRRAGGTPLSDALLLAKTLFNERGGHPFMLSLTDGKPDHRERYRDILHGCQFPVLGIYCQKGGNFSTDEMNEAAYYHALEYRSPDDMLAGARNLVKQVII